MSLTEPPTDRELSVRAAAGDDQAFAIIIGRYKAPLFAFIRRYIGKNEDALDLLQEVFLSAWQALHRYDPDRPLGPWLTTIALNKCRDHDRKAKLRRMIQFAWPTNAAALADTAPNAYEIAEMDQDLKLLEKAITLLPRSLKEPLLLTVFGGLSHAEAGVQLGISAKAIEGKTRRARKELERQINEWMSETERE